jgi:hypothetical protein
MHAYNHSVFFPIVSGNANFVMSSMRLTIGGFTQAGVARTLIEMPSNSEKGLSHRFLWMFPKPLFGTFAALEEVNKGFTDEMCRLLDLSCMHVFVTNYSGYTLILVYITIVEQQYREISQVHWPRIVTNAKQE